MIERIPDQIPVQTGEWRGTTFDIIPKETFAMACRKINELVDAVNALVYEHDKDSDWYDDAQTRADNAQPDAESRPENVQDKFAEQRKWIGKLCQFWDDDAFVTSNDWAFGMLTSIDKGMQYQYCCNENCNFKHCEPVKPDDDIIYKGGDNEL